MTAVQINPSFYYQAQVLAELPLANKCKCLKIRMDFYGLKGLCGRSFNNQTSVMLNVVILGVAINNYSKSVPFIALLSSFLVIFVFKVSQISALQIVVFWYNTEVYLWDSSCG